MKFNLKHATYTVNDGWCETEWDDGRKLQAVPVMDSESIARSRSLGYEGTDEEAVWAMTREHDFLHTVLTECHKTPKYSFALRPTIDKELQFSIAKREEELVLCVQQLLNAVRKTGQTLV